MAMRLAVVLLFLYSTPFFRLPSPFQTSRMRPANA